MGAFGLWFRVVKVPRKLGLLFGARNPVEQTQERIFVTYEVFPVMSMKIPVFWDVMPCSLLKNSATSHSVLLPLSIGILLMFEVEGLPNSSVHFYQNTRRHIREDI
jgi:hypothetical protein